MKTAVILSGAGRYSDPWHPFGETSRCLADLLATEDIDVVVDDDVDHRLAQLNDIDLLVINAGDPSRNIPDDATYEEQVVSAARDKLLAHISRGGSVLGMHTAASSLRDIPEWPEILGGQWVPGEAMHPEFGRAQINITGADHPISTGLAGFELEDERYSYLRTEPDITPLATHLQDGVKHPVFWAREHGNSRVVYDALGHNRSSYESPHHQELLLRAVRWLLHLPVSP